VYGETRVRKGRKREKDHWGGARGDKREVLKKKNRVKGKGANVAKKSLESFDHESKKKPTPASKERHAKERKEGEGKFMQEKVVSRYGNQNRKGFGRT